MRPRSVLTFCLGVALAGGAVYLVHQRLNGLPAAEAHAPALATTELVVARKDLAYGARLTRELLTTVTWPAGAVPAGAFRSADELLGGSGEPRVVLRAMLKDEPVLAGRVSGFGGKATIATKVEEGKRAFSIRINDVSGVAGFVLPGDRVDLLLTRQMGDGRDDLVTDVILQNVAVLGIDQLADEQREKPQVGRTATVEVTPGEAQKLALAMQVGTLSLALRNVASSHAADVGRMRVSDLVLADRPGAPGPKAPSVRVRRGTGEPTVTTVGAP